MARCHVPSSLFISTRNQTTTSFFFIIKYRVFTCIQSAVISFVLVSGYNQAFILHKSYMRYTAQSGGAILAFRSLYIGDHRRETSNQGSVFRKEHSFLHPYALQAPTLPYLLRCRRHYTNALLFRRYDDLTLPAMILPYGDPTILQHTSYIRVH